eukprot:g2655.t1
MTAGLLMACAVAVCAVNSVAPLLGPPAESAWGPTNPVQVSGLSKVTLSVAAANFSACAQWWEAKMGFTKEAAFTSALGQVQRMNFRGLVVELISFPNSQPGVYRADVPAQSGTQGLTQFSFRTQNNTVIERVLAARGVPTFFKFANDALQLYLLVARDPFSRAQVEFLQPYKDTSPAVLNAGNPLGLKGFNQITLSVASVRASASWYYDTLTAIVPLSQYLELPSFGTTLGIARVGRLRVEQIEANGSVPLGALTPPAAPRQAAFTGLVSYAVTVPDLVASVAVLRKRGAAIEYELGGGAWGGRSAWVRDANGCLLEIFAPAAQPAPAPARQSDDLPGYARNLIGLGSVAVVVAATLVCSGCVKCPPPRCRQRGSAGALVRL